MGRVIRSFISGFAAGLRGDIGSFERRQRMFSIQCRRKRQAYARHLESISKANPVNGMSVWEQVGFCFSEAMNGVDHGQEQQ